MTYFYTLEAMGRTSETQLQVGEHLRKGLTIVLFVFYSAEAEDGFRHWMRNSDVCGDGGPGGHVRSRLPEKTIYQ